MFLSMLNIEIRKTLKHPALWGGLAALLVLLAMSVLVHHLEISRGYLSATGGLEQDFLNGLSFFGWIGILVYATTGSVIAAFDYPDRSIQLWLTRGLSRPVMLSARFAAILLFDLFFVVFTVLVLMGSGATSRSLFFGRVDTSNLDWIALVGVILRVFWGSLPYLALTVLFAVLSRSPLFAAAGTIVYGSVVERLLLSLSDRFPNLIRYLPAQLDQALQIHNLALDRAAGSLPPGAANMPEGQAALLIGMIFLILSTISLVIFSRQDLGG